ncbi:cartilage oligomeric matrix protein [Agrilus planipennis]|uniref:Cartilage oligomeric matrix protein n=1 Tax=Agrilus planipennis TaxID=224129 RepID=A0A7F5R7I6_AGRPL|nr:cartilage oligomeric matrix protein [Agrilus planipennis]
MGRRNGIVGILFVLTCALSLWDLVANAVNIDSNAAAELEDFILEDELVISFQNLKARKRTKASVETLFAADFPGSRQKLVLMLDRRHKRVIVETVENGKNRVQYFTIDSLEDNTHINSLIFVVNQKQPGAHITLVLNCLSYGKIATPKAMKDMYFSMDDPSIQVYTERKYFVGFDKGDNLRNVFSRNECPSLTLSNEYKRSPLYNTFEEDDPNIQSDRADIPLVSALDDGAILNALNNLIKAVNKLSGDVQNQQNVIDHLRRLIEECELCKQPKPIQIQATCATHPPDCFPGVRCHDTPEGPRCGSCPRGYIGNGYECTPGRTCSENPCFPGVRCRDIESPPGYQCGQCPSGYEGDGEHCDRRSGCQYEPCHPGQRCIEISAPPYYKCEGCPPGFTGNGEQCRDLDECDLARPCHPDTSCTNLEPGYICGPCPAGYTGDSGGVRRVGIEEAERNRQQCYDIDECRDNPSICGPNSICENSQGSYSCRSACGENFIFVNASFGCSPKEGHCPDGLHCPPNSQCVPLVGGRYRCGCRFGYVGDGTVCGRDTDLDGWPDHDLHCSSPKCRKDNCVDLPNSGQEDADGDGLGDKCDPDADNDRIPNGPDNCPLVANPDQADSDIGGPDRQGDACDNCPTMPNYDQSDIDHDGRGDVCDDDMDGDGIYNERDNCPRHRNTDQRDQDRDGIGDACDNCPQVPNQDQTDSDLDGVGDICSRGGDRDHDGIIDERDNCPQKANADQADTDGDGRGDACDPDIDGDSIINEKDNCVYGYNPDQKDFNGNNVGDVCEDDFDLDTVPNDLDNCPNNSLIHTTDFSRYMTVALDPEGESQIDPNWVIYAKGAEIWQTMNSDPGLAVGEDRFGGVDFEGTFYVDTEIDDDYAGFVFSYQSNKKFYVVMWKKHSQPYWQHTPFNAVADPGIQLKVVNSETGPGKILRNSLWHTGNTPNQVKLLWKDPRNVGWKEKTPYRWLLHHRPKIGLIRFKLFEVDRKVADSGNVYDTTLRGGKLGVFCFSQEMIIWSDLLYRCNDAVPQSIYDDLPPKLKKLVNIDNSRISSKIVYE